MLRGAQKPSDNRRCEDSFRSCSWWDFYLDIQPCPDAMVAPRTTQRELLGCSLEDVNDLGAQLRSLNFTPEDQMRLVQMPPEQSAIILLEMDLLHSVGFRPKSMFDFANLPPEGQAFIQLKCHELYRIGFISTDMLKLARYGVLEQEHIMKASRRLHMVGASRNEIINVARMSSKRRDGLYSRCQALIHRMLGQSHAGSKDESAEEERKELLREMAVNFLTAG